MNPYLVLFVIAFAIAFVSLPSSPTRRWKYDVFLSFRGSDTRKGITFELYDRLHRMGIRTFKDDPDIEVGQPISPTLIAAIEESRFAIVVISPNCASSTWCLEELTKIYQCMKNESRILPFFFHVEPSDVRRRKSFEEAFTQHENSGQHRSEKVQQWRDALEKMASISGWHTQNFRTDREQVNAIVDFVCSKLLSTAVESRRHFRVLSIGSESIVGFVCTTKSIVDFVFTAIVDFVYTVIEEFVCSIASIVDFVCTAIVDFVYTAIEEFVCTAIESIVDFAIYCN